MASPRVEGATPAAELGEGPHWRAADGALFYVDAPGGELRRFEPAARKHTAVKTGFISVAVPVAGRADAFVAGCGHRIQLLTWDGAEAAAPAHRRTLAEADTEPGKETNRLNDGKADASGRLWIGTMGELLGPTDCRPEQGALYSLEAGSRLRKHVTGITLSNGIGWSPDNKHMYYVDTLTRRLDVFDFDLAAGEVANRRPVLDLAAADIKGFPDGLTVDADGRVWLACYDGSQVLQVDPAAGRVLRSVPIPAANITSVAWGGPGLDQLFVTSARAGLSEAERGAFPAAGCTFRVTGLGARGLSANEVRL